MGHSATDQSTAGNNEGDKTSRGGDSAINEGRKSSSQNKYGKFKQLQTFSRLP